MRLLKKRVLPVFLAAVVSVSCIMGSSIKAEAAAVVPATIGLAEVLEAIFAVFGFCYLTDAMISSGWTDGNAALQPEWDDIYDSMNESYEEIRGGGGDPGQDPEGPQIPRSFEAIVDTAMTKGVLELAQGEYDIIKHWVVENITTSYELGALICDKTMPDGLNVDLSYISAKTSAMIYQKKCISAPVGWSYILEMKYAPCFYNNCIWYLDGPASVINEGVTYKFNNGIYDSKSDTCCSVFGSVKSVDFSVGSVRLKAYSYPYDQMMSRYPELSSQDEVIDYLKNVYQADPEIVPAKPPIWITPGIKGPADSPLEFPETAPETLNVPTPDQLEELSRKLNPETNPDAALDAEKNVAAYIDSLIQVDPGPGVDPTDPVDPPVDPDNPDDPGSDPDPGTFTADLKTLFPFCIPFDLIKAFNVLSVEGQAPVFSLPFKVDYGSVHIDEQWEIDFADFESVVKIFRVLETIGFIVALILITRIIIKG